MRGRNHRKNMGFKNIIILWVGGRGAQIKGQFCGAGSFPPPLSGHQGQAYRFGLSGANGLYLPSHLANVLLVL